MPKTASRRYAEAVHEPETKMETRIIGVVSGKGGVGKTTFSANLAIALNALDQKVVVVDCNVTTPHLSYYLGVKNFSTSINAVFAGDVDIMFAPLDQNGVMFIPASERFVDLKRVDMKDLRKIIGRLAKKGDFDFIILDSAPGLGREAIGVLHACNEIVFLAKPTVPNVMDIVRCKEVARLLGHKRFSMVLNMVRGKDHELTRERAEELFGMPVLGAIPFDENIMDSTAEGVPIMWYKPKAPSCNSFLQIALQLAEINLLEFVEDVEEERVGLFGEMSEDEEEIEEEEAEEEEEEPEEEEEIEERIIPIAESPVREKRRRSRRRKRKFVINVGAARRRIAGKVRNIFKR